MCYFSEKHTLSVSVERHKERLPTDWADISVVIMTNNCSLEGWEMSKRMIGFDVIGTIRAAPSAVQRSGAPLMDDGQMERSNP